MSEDNGGVEPFYRGLEVDADLGDDEGEGDGIEAEGELEVPLLEWAYAGEWLRYVDDADGRSVPGLHVFRLVEHRDTRNRRTSRAEFMGLVPYYWEESDLRSAVDEDGERQFPPGEYRVQLKGDRGRVVKSAQVTLGGRRPAPTRRGRAGERDESDGRARFGEERAAGVDELRKTLERERDQNAELRKALEREREQNAELHRQVIRAGFEVEMRQLSIATAEQRAAEAEKRAVEAEKRARAAENRAVEAEQRAAAASAPADLSTVLQQLRERLARDQAALAELTGPPTGAGGKNERGQVLEEAAGGLAATMRELVSLGKTAMRGIEGAGLAGEADELAEALARKGA